MKKPFFLLLGILLIFVIIYFLLIQKEKKTFSPRKMENFLELDSALVDRIEFGKFGTKLIFQKTNQQWYMIEPDSFRADNNAIGQLLGMASHLGVGEVISSNRQKQFYFQVDTVTGTRLNFLAGENQLASLVIGKTSSDYLHAYLRKTESEDVYLAKGQFTRMANRPIDQWRDLNIFTFDPKQVKEIEISQDKEKFRLTQEDTLWQLSLYPYQKNFQADSKKTKDYIRTLADMKADNFAKKPEIEGLDFKNPQLVLKITFMNGHEEKLFVTQKHGENDRYFVKTTQDKSVFVLYKYNFNNLAKKFEDFQSKEEI